MQDRQIFSKLENSNEIKKEVKKLVDDIENFSATKDEAAQFWKNLYLGLTSNN